ncbi:hypothetical protein Pla108_31940 [Botrimarina colliarenosi]|uniref:Uncharacterized protein n=1 Tax=Botrimarina colliarenosi TaxID=2528001 RepID=A0A5C6A7X1_9BACT|nr:hypothetical protein [Botrimarina colliarenosi]TWT96112.1 hypothetical protein Pla108_31940 [Botrimarina colliarenosi]
MSLPLRAENNPKFYSRFKWLGLGAIAFMFYCLYDGYINYPDQQVRGVALMELAEEILPNDKKKEIAQAGHGAHDAYQLIKKQLPDFPELKEAWEAKATAEGWLLAPPAKLRTEGDILGQYVMAGFAGLGGLWFLFTVWRTNGRWFELNENGITSRWGESFSLDQVTAIDKKQWRDKGIARLRYQGANGRQRTFVIDNYKYHKKTTDRIFYLIEQHVGVDKIVGGKPEVDSDAAPTPDMTPVDA